MKKIISVLLVLMLVLSATGVLAASEGMGNFKAKNTYNASVYTDVPASEWYNVSVKKCYELALMLGNGDGKFNPEGNVTLAEVLTMASRVHSIYNGGDGTLDTSYGEKWYDGIVKYATEKGIIKNGDFSGYERAATRAEMAYVFSNSLPAGEFNVINSQISVPDVKAADKYGSVIFNLYKSGIVVGSDDKHSFFPDSNIKRCEAAAIICRVVDKTERIKLETTAPAPGGNEDEEFIDEDFYEEDYDEIVSDEGLFDDTEETAWNGALDDSQGPTRKYTADYKKGIDQLYFSLKGSFADKELDLSKAIVGFGVIDWITEGLSLVGRDVTLSGKYTKCATKKELDSPGEYYMFENTLEGVDCTIISINLAEVDARAIRSLEKFNQAGTNDVTHLVFAAEDGFYGGFDASYVILDKLLVVVTVNNFDSFPGLKYYANGYNTTSKEPEAVEMFEDKIVKLMSCESITFETEDEKITVEITQDILENGIDLG